MKSVTRLPGCVGFYPLLPVLGRELRNRLLLALFLGVLAATSAWSQQASHETTTNQQPSGKTETELSPASKQQILASYGRLPLSFEVNRGQTDDHVKFLSRRPGSSLFLTPAEAVLVVSKPLEERNPKTLPGAWPVAPPKFLMSALHMKLVGANPAPSVYGLEELETKSNYFIGNDPKKWQTNVPNYAKVKYVSVYPGVDLAYYGNDGKLEYDFIVSPGADARAITLEFNRGEKLRIDERGDVVVKAKIGDVRLERPVVYQEVGGVRQQVAARYVGRGRNQIGFRVGKYDVTKTLVIDPVLSYSTYAPALLSGGAATTGIAVDSAGSAYVVGTTNSANLSTTAGAYQTTYLAGLTSSDLFVIKLNAAGSGVMYSTYLGDSIFNSGQPGPGIAVDSAGSAYVTASTRSTSFPTTPGAFQTRNNGASDVFVTKLNATGSALIYSTLLGGYSDDLATAIAVDSAGSAYVTGTTPRSSSNSSFPTFPTTAGAFQTLFDIYYGFNTFGACFVSKLTADGSGLSYSTFLGSNANNYLSVCNAIAVDSAGSAYVTGYTEGGPNFPTTPGAFQSAGGPSAYSAFVTKLTPDGSGLSYSTLLTGNSNGDVGGGIAVDSAGSAYLTGLIGSPDTTFPASTRFPSTPGAFQTTFSGQSTDVFATKLTADGSRVIYSTYLGDSGMPGVFDLPAPSIAVDSADSACVTGVTNSTSFPITPDAFQTSLPWYQGSAFVTKLTADGSGVIYSTYLGGSGLAQGWAIAVDSAGSAYVTGAAGSNSFPTTAGAVYPTGGGTGFVAKFAFDQPSVLLSPTSLTFPGTGIGQSSSPQTVTFSASGSGALAFSSIVVTGTSAGDFVITSNTCFPTLAANASCQAQVAFTPTVAGTRSATLQFTDDVSGSPQSVPLSGTGLSQVSTSTDLNSSLNPALFGQTVTFTALVSTTGSAAITGTVMFYDGATSLGSSPLQPAKIKGINAVEGLFSTSSLSVGTHSITASYGGDANYNSSTSGALTQTVNQAIPMINWPVPAAMTYGDILSPTQLNATANVAGTFTYSPGFKAFLGAGSQTLTATFTPTDTTDYTSATASVQLVVYPATPTINWPPPASITYGTALSSAQLNATANVLLSSRLNAINVPGTFSYTPSSGTQLTVGTQTLRVSFTPTDNTDYTSATASVQLVVNQATSTVTVTCPTAPVMFTGSALTPCTGGYTTSDALSGALTVSYTNNTNVGTATASVSYAGDGNHAGSSGTGSFVINKAAATVTLSNLTQTYTGSALTPTATTTPAGLATTLTGAPDTNAGSYAVTATVTDPNYTGSANGSFVINQSPATVTLGSMSQTYSGTALSPTVATSPTGLATTLTGAPDTNAGTYSVTATVTNPNYAGSASGSFVVNKAALSVGANNATRPFGAPNPTFGGTLTGVRTGDNITAYFGTTATAASLPVGTYAITPFLSDPGGRLGNYTVSSTNGVLTVTQAATTTALNVAPDPSNFGQSVTLTATIAPVAPSVGTATGTVTFRDGSATLGTGALNSADEATFTISSLAAGAHILTASYGGDPNFTGSASSTIGEQVNCGLAISVSPTTVARGGWITATGTLQSCASTTQTMKIKFTLTGPLAPNSCGSADTDMFTTPPFIVPPKTLKTMSFPLLVPRGVCVGTYSVVATTLVNVNGTFVPVSTSAASLTVTQ
jgi:hypothetical protein